MNKDRTNTVNSSLRNPATAQADEALRRVRTMQTSIAAADLPRSVTVAQPGEVLRMTRALHPLQTRFDQVDAAERAVARTARLLDEATNDHQRSLLRLAQTRAHFGVPQTTGTGTKGGDPGEYTGRIIARQRLTALNKTSGTLALTCGEDLSWTAAASYVDALEQLFEGVPVVVRGPVDSSGTLSIQQISLAPQPRSDWDNTLTGTYEQLASLGQATITEVVQQKTRLIDQFGASCMECDLAFTKATQASLAVRPGDQNLLLCRPCKENWKDVQGAATTTIETAVA
ncbi:hypothetical protein ACIBI8_37115 [Streptomyces sp. NPDC050529]|uniref:hypothetical protein n=1 Tax=Streptomyces sp. NPDC050529 TaxID=3365624 RepID=UPI0037979066